MVIRKTELITDEVYHVFSKSIAGYRIFNDEREFLRMRNLIKYYQYNRPQISFSRYLNANDNIKKNTFNNSIKSIQIVAYCFMQTHIHLILSQLIDDGISNYMRLMLNAYAKYFNLRHRRKGPLWEGPFRNVHVKNDYQLLHLTRYVHLNPTTASLVSKPEDWKYSSYEEYITNNKREGQVCDYNSLLNIEPKTYKQFVEDNIGYQRDLYKIKKLIIE